MLYSVTEPTGFWSRGSLLPSKEAMQSQFGLACALFRTPTDREDKFLNKFCFINPLPFKDDNNAVSGLSPDPTTYAYGISLVCLIFSIYSSCV